MGKFVIAKNANDEFQFYFVDNNGDTILRSSGYTRKFMCEKGVESVKTNSQDSTKFFKKTISDDKVYFNLKAFNGKIIGMSKMYEDRVSRDKGMEFLKEKAPNAAVEDQTKSTDISINTSSLVY